MNAWDSRTHETSYGTEGGTSDLAGEVDWLLVRERRERWGGELGDVGVVEERGGVVG